MNFKLYSLFFFHFISTIIAAQVQYEKEPTANIKSIVFKGSDSGLQFPVIRQGEKFVLSFDDLNANEEDYYYKIEHCNYDWTPSNLLKQQYIDGIDNQRVRNYRNSLSTLIPYSHYELILPNEQLRFKITGNYILKIFNKYDEAVFSRRFIIYSDAVTVGVSLKRSRDLSIINEKQVVQININSKNLQLINPRQEVKLAIIQNSNWNHVITNIKPQFYSGNELIYKYDLETSFDGGNEYLFFDNKDIRNASNGVFSTELRDYYHSYPYTAESRKNKPYTYNPDINGDFEIRNINGSDNDTEADYSMVHFSLEYNNSIGLNKVFVYGKFNNYQLTDENELKINPESGKLEGSILLKQGFYNYKFVLKYNDGTVDYNFISGNRFETENDYLVLVYYRNFGALYDSIIGIGTGSSVNISN